IFIETKGLTILTLLFGIGFAIQTRRIPLIFYARRLFGLFVIGLAHGLFWFNDILRVYALGGLFLMLTLRIPPLSLGAIGFAIAVFPWSQFQSIPSDVAGLVSSIYGAFSGLSFSDIVWAYIRYYCWL